MQTAFIKSGIRMSGISKVLQSDSLLAYGGDEEFAASAVRVERSDGRLIEAVLAGDETAFEQLFDRHKRFVGRTAARYFQRSDQIEEIIQISFAKAFVELAKFRGEHRLSFASWLGRITSNACLDALRSKKRRPEDLHCELSNSDTETLLEFADGSDEGAENEIANRDLSDKLLGRLPAEDRALLQMLYAEEMTVAEIGEEMGWSVSKVKIRAWRARNALRKIMKKLL